MIKTYIVDSFTDQIFTGNPAGVCLVKSFPKDEMMLHIAKELGLSETAFVCKIDEKPIFNIRYFSPVMEIPLCGHATLAASKIIFGLKNRLDKITFKTIENLNLEIKRAGELIEMQFPVYKTVPAEAPSLLLSALGIRVIKNSVFNDETNILLLEIEDSKELQNLKPDFEALLKSHDSINGVLITALSNQKEYDFESRYFWPWSGTNEDPVTGGTHTFLAKYWGDRLDKTRMKSFQCSERTGFMEVELLSNDKMLIRGQAQLVLRGEFNVS